MAKIDKQAQCVQVDPVTGLVRIDGIIAFKIIQVPGAETRLQFFDRDKMRSKYRGSEFVEIPISVLVQKIYDLTS